MLTAAMLLLPGLQKQKETQGREERHSCYLHLQVPLLSTAAFAKPFQSQRGGQVRSRQAAATSKLCMQFFMPTSHLELSFLA